MYECNHATVHSSVYMAHQNQHLLITCLCSVDVELKSETTFHSPCRATVYSSVWSRKRSVRTFGRETLSGTLAMELEPPSRKIRHYREWRKNERKRDRDIGTL